MRNTIIGTNRLIGRFLKSNHRFWKCERFPTLATICKSVLGILEGKPHFKFEDNMNWHCRENDWKPWTNQKAEQGGKSMECDHMQISSRDP